MLPLSASQVQGYLACSLRYRFRYVDRIPPPWRPAALAFGGSVHAAVEWYRKERHAGRSPTVEEVQRIFTADWFAANVEPEVFGERDTKDALTAKGRAMLAAFLAEEDDAVPQAVEERFELPLVDPLTGEVHEVELRGVIDCVDQDGSVVELKTGARALSQGDVDRHLQLSIYALARYLATGEILALKLELLTKTKEPKLLRYETARSLEDLAWTARLVAAVARAIEAGQFLPSPSWLCTECEYFAHCQKWQGPS